MINYDCKFWPLVSAYLVSGLLLEANRADFVIILDRKGKMAKSFSCNTLGSINYFPCDIPAVFLYTPEAARSS